jgi:MFS family permease
MLAVGMGVFMGTLDMSIINVSLPTLVKQLQTTFPTIQWVILGYVLVVTSMMLGAARLGDMFRKKGLYVGGLIIFTVGSLLCGVSPNVGWLIAFRILQGCGAVMMQALGTAIIVEVFPPYERGRAMGIIGSIVSVGIALGPAVGGLIIGMIGWRWIFLVNVPIGIITLLISLYFVPSTASREGNQSFDLAGALIMLVTLVCFALGMTMGQNYGFGNLTVQGLIIIAGVGLISFMIIENKIHQPMIDLSLFRNILFSLSLLMGLLSFVVTGGVFLIPFFLELVKGYPTHQVGIMMMVTPVLMGIIAPLSGWLSDRFGTRGISLIGLLIDYGTGLPNQGGAVWYRDGVFPKPQSQRDHGIGTAGTVGCCLRAVGAFSKPGANDRHSADGSYFYIDRYVFRANSWDDQCHRCAETGFGQWFNRGLSSCRNDYSALHYPGRGDLVGGEKAGPGSMISMSLPSFLMQRFGATTRVSARLSLLTVTSLE